MKRILTHSIFYTIIISFFEILLDRTVDSTFIALSFICIISLVTLVLLLARHSNAVFRWRFARAFIITSISSVLITIVTLGASLYQEPDYFEQVKIESIDQSEERSDDTQEAFDILFSPVFITLTIILIYFAMGFINSLIAAGISGMSKKEDQDQIFEASPEEL